MIFFNDLSLHIRCIMALNCNNYLDIYPIPYTLYMSFLTFLTTLAFLLYIYYIRRYIILYSSNIYIEGKVSKVGIVRIVLFWTLGGNAI